MLSGKKIYFVPFAFIVLLFVISGCVSTPPQNITPAPTLIPASSPPVMPPYSQPHDPEQPVLLIPTINVTSYRANVTGDTNFTIRFEVSGGTNQGNISHASIHWGFRSGGPDIKDYGRFSNVYTGRVPQQFSMDLIAPASGIIFFRAHAIVDGVDIYSSEHQIRIIP